MYNKIKNKVNVLKQPLANIHFKEVLKGGVISFGVKIFTLSLGFFTTWFLSSHYGAGTIGQLALLDSAVSMITIFTVLGMNNSLVKLVPEHIAKYSFYSAALTYKKMFIFVSLTSISTALIYFLFHREIAETIFHKSNLEWLFLLVSPLIFIRSLQSLNMALIQALKKIYLITFFQLAQPVLFTGLIVLGTYIYANKMLPIYVQVLIDSLLFITSLIAIYQIMYKKITPQKYHTVTNHELFSLSLPMMLTGILTAILFQTDIIMLGIMKTDHDVGIYSVVLKVAGLTSFVLMSINTFAAPKFSELYHEGKKEDLIFVAQQFSKILLITSLLIGSIFILFGNYILLYFGTEFTKGYYPLIIIVISWIFHAWAGPIAVMMNMIGLHKQLQYIVFLAAATNVILNLLLIPKYGITGSATATMISGLIIDILTIIVIWKKEGFFILYLPKVFR